MSIYIPDKNWRADQPTPIADLDLNLVLARFL